MNGREYRRVEIGINTTCLIMCNAVKYEYNEFRSARWPVMGKCYTLYGVRRKVQNNTRDGEVALYSRFVTTVSRPGSGIFRHLVYVFDLLTLLYLYTVTSYSYLTTDRFTCPGVLRND